jgi:hypothetical protein
MDNPLKRGIKPLVSKIASKISRENQGIPDIQVSVRMLRFGCLKI